MAEREFKFRVVGWLAALVIGVGIFVLLIRLLGVIVVWALLALLLIIAFVPRWLRNR